MIGKTPSKKLRKEKGCPPYTQEIDINEVISVLPERIKFHRYILEAGLHLVTRKEMRRDIKKAGDSFILFVTESDVIRDKTLAITHLDGDLAKTAISTTPVFEAYTLATSLLSETHYIVGCMFIYDGQPKILVIPLPKNKL